MKIGHTRNDIHVSRPKKRRLLTDEGFPGGKRQDGTSDESEVYIKVKGSSQ